MAETRDSLESIAAPEENKVLIPVHSPPPDYHQSVCEGQCCVCHDSLLKESSYHPYHCANTFMGMPAGLRSTKDLGHNLERLHRTSELPQLRVKVVCGELEKIEGGI